MSFSYTPSQLTNAPQAPTAGDIYFDVGYNMWLEWNPQLGWQALQNNVSLTNFATGGSIGTAPQVVDDIEYVLINQTAASQTLTLPSPSVPSLIRKIYISNTGSTSFTLLDVSVAAGATLSALWTGSAWSAII